MLKMLPTPCCLVLGGFELHDENTSLFSYKASQPHSGKVSKLQKHMYHSVWNRYLPHLAKALKRSLPVQQYPKTFQSVQVNINLMPGPVTKAAKMVPSIGTHNGTFHCDEALACFMLQLLPEYSESCVVRSRDQAVLDKCDIVVDVGGIYDPSKHRYDHHQRTFSESMKSLGGGPWEIKLSSAGLVYLHFGKRIIASLLDKQEKDPMVIKLYHKIYENLIIEVDAIDNGVETHDGESRYHISTNLSSRVAGLNPAWNEPDPNPDECFVKAQKLVGEAFMDRINYYQNSWLPAKKLVEEAVDQRFEVDKSGEILVFSSGGCPWKDHLFDIEDERELDPQIKFVLFADQAGAWRVQCVPVRPKSFANRLSLLESWRGLRDEALSLQSGIPQCIFVHASGFIGGNRTYEGALEMARLTLQSRTEGND